MPANIYVVTDGSYSEYRICGVFDDKDKAEAFCEYYNYDAVEKHGVNPEAPECNGFMYQCHYYFVEDMVGPNPNIARLSNETEAEDWDAWTKYDDIDSVHTICCRYEARDDKHAAKIASDRITAFLAGSTVAEGCMTVNTGRMIKGVPVIEGRNVRLRSYYQMVGGKPVRVHTEKAPD